MTNATAHVRLNTAEFKSGLGEIVDLVSQACEKTNPRVVAHIEKFSKKAQDEIYGRFNEAFNGGVKDAAKGKKFLEENLDFRSLTEKVTEVAEDIELAGEVNELFKKNAPIQTIHGQYNKLSLAARKEIEKHLASTAEKAKSQEVEKALIKVFGGMGILAEATAKVMPTKPVQKELSEDVVQRIDRFANWYKADLCTMEEVEKEEMPVDGLFTRLFPCTKLLIQQMIAAKRPPEWAGSQLFDYIHNPPIKETVLSVLKSFRANASIESIMKNVEMQNMGSIEGSMLCQYLGFPRSLAYAYLQNNPDCTYGSLSSHMKTIARENNPALQSLASAFETEDGLIVREMAWAEQCMSTAMSLDFAAFDKLSTYLNSSTFERGAFVAIYNSLSPTVKRLYKDIVQKNNKPAPETASWDDLKNACKKLEPAMRTLWLGSKQSMYTNKKMFTDLDFLEGVFPVLPKTKSPSPKAEPSKSEIPLNAETSTEKKILVLARAYKSDLNTLQLAQAYLKAECKDVDYEKQYLLDLFKSLSPFAQLLIELHLLQNYFKGYSDVDYEKKTTMTMEDTVRASMEYSCNYYTATNDGLKKTMLEVLEAFQTQVPGKQIIEKLHLEYRNPRLGSYERDLLKDYLSYPRILADDRLKSYPDCTLAKFDEYLLSGLRQKVILDENKDIETMQRNEEWYTKEYQQRYKSDPATIEEKKQRYTKFSVYDSWAFTKMDFLDQVIELF